MRFTITVILLVSILLSAVHTAAVLNLKRDVAPDVQTCVNNINTFSTQLDALLKQIEAGTDFNIGLGKDDRFNDVMSTTESSCCGIHTAISDADAAFFLTTVGNVTSKVQTVLSVLVNKKDTYNFWITLLVQGQLVGLDNYSGRLTSCFVTFNPSSKSTILQGYTDQIKRAFTAARKAYNAGIWYNL